VQCIAPTEGPHVVILPLQVTEVQPTPNIIFVEDLNEGSQSTTFALRGERAGLGPALADQENVLLWDPSKTSTKFDFFSARDRDFGVVITGMGIWGPSAPFSDFYNQVLRRWLDLDARSTLCFHDTCAPLPSSFLSISFVYFCILGFIFVLRRLSLNAMAGVVQAGAHSAGCHLLL
jgi:hypothetical protein